MWPKKVKETSPEEAVPEEIPFRGGKIVLSPEKTKQLILECLNKAQGVYKIETHFTKKELEILSLKWAFLRQNQDYRKSQAELQKEYDTNDIFGFEALYYSLKGEVTKNLPKAISFVSRWGSYIIIDPNKHFRDFSKYELAEFGKAFVTSEIPYVSDQEELFKKAFSASFTVNLWAPKQILLRHFEREVDICKKLLKPIMKQKKLSYKNTRLRIQDYKGYLKVKNKVKSPSDIEKMAKERCTPNKDDLSYNKRFYKRQLAAANKIIKEGAGQISF